MNIDFGIKNPVLVSFSVKNDTNNMWYSSEHQINTFRYSEDSTIVTINSTSGGLALFGVVSRNNLNINQS